MSAGFSRDLWLMILIRLPPVALLMSNTVCKQLYEITSSDFIWERHKKRVIEHCHYAEGVFREGVSTQRIFSHYLMAPFIECVRGLLLSFNHETAAALIKSRFYMCMLKSSVRGIDIYDICNGVYYFYCVVYLNEKNCDKVPFWMKMQTPDEIEFEVNDATSMKPLLENNVLMPFKALVNDEDPQKYLTPIFVFDNE